MIVVASTCVQDDDVISWCGAGSGEDLVSITFGDRDTREQITIDFSGPGALDRLAEVAVRGARELRAKLAATESERDEVDGDRPVGLAG